MPTAVNITSRRKSKVTKKPKSDISIYFEDLEKRQKLMNKSVSRQEHNLICKFIKNSLTKLNRITSKKQFIQIYSQLLFEFSKQLASKGILFSSQKLYHTKTSVLPEIKSIFLDEFVFIADKVVYGAALKESSRLNQREFRKAFNEVKNILFNLDYDCISRLIKEHGFENVRLAVDLLKKVYSEYIDTARKEYQKLCEEKEDTLDYDIIHHAITSPAYVVSALDTFVKK